jgi:hypothetical protein
MIHTTHKLSYLIRTAGLAGSLAIAVSLPAQTPSFFPLEVGNVWLYRSAVSNASIGNIRQVRTISVHGTQTIGSRVYFNVADSAGEELLRVEPTTGEVVAYDFASNSEQPWLSLNLQQGSTFPTSMRCASTGTIASRNASVTTPAGPFSSAVEVTFQGNCADAGVTRQFYAPNIGLVSGEETTFAGALKFDLVYYHVGGSTGAAAEVSFTVALSAPRYTTDDLLQARLTLRSSATDPIHLHFPSGQSFELKIYDDKKNLVNIWSKGIFFTMMVRDEDFGPGEKTYGISMALTGLTPGRYIAEAYLTTDPVLYLGQVSFEIVPKSMPVDFGGGPADVAKPPLSRVSGR